MLLYFLQLCPMLQESTLPSSLCPEPHSLPPTPQLILSRKPLRTLQQNGNRWAVTSNFSLPCLQTYLPTSQCPNLLEEMLFFPPNPIPHLGWELHFFLETSLCWSFPLSCIYFKFSFFTGFFFNQEWNLLYSNSSLTFKSESQVNFRNCGEEMTSMDCRFLKNFLSTYSNSATIYRYHLLNKRAF